MSFKDEKDTKARHEVVQNQLKDNPELASKISKISSIVDTEMALMNDQYFSDKAFAREAQLRKWIRDMFEDRTLNVSDAEDFIKFIKKFRADNNMEPTGQAAYFIYKNKIITLTILGHIHEISKYVDILEKQFIAHDQKRKTLYNTSFWGYIKLAFKKLFGGK